MIIVLAKEAGIYIYNPVAGEFKQQAAIKSPPFPCRPLKIDRSMATKEFAPPLKPKATFLGGCLRFGSHENSRSNKSSSWLCWKKASATKTVPLVDVVVSEKQVAAAELNKLVNEETKSKHVKFEVPAVTVDVLEDPGGLPIPIVVSDTSSKQKPSDQMGSDASKDYASQKRRLSFCRKVDSIRTAPDSPAVQLQQQESTTHVTVAAVKSPLPTPDVTPRRTRRVRGGGGSPAIASSTRMPWGLVSSNEKNMRTTKRLDPLVGMTIILVTLVIMVLWGRLCAILCTAAWFYLLPRLTTHPNSNYLTTSTAGNSFPHPRDDGDDRFDFMSSDEYKKKVILEGFLERNNHHRSHLLQ